MRDVVFLSSCALSQHQGATKGTRMHTTTHQPRHAFTGVLAPVLRAHCVSGGLLFGACRP
jgi:hypothetical protein